VIELRTLRFGALDARAKIILGVHVEVDYTVKVAEGLYVTRMAVCEVLGLPRFGPIFGEKLMNGKKAEIIEKDLRG
jgi:ribulose 1,5-bisphosphate synthetase/thiazole synthase